MPFKIESKQKNGYILLTTVGKIRDRNEYLEFAKAVFQDVLYLSGKTVLVDDSQLLQIKGIMDQVALVNHFDTEDFSGLRGYKLAEVVHPDDHEAMKFFETYSQNRGYTMKCFKSIKEAKQWLNIK